MDQETSCSLQATEAKGTSLTTQAANPEEINSTDDNSRPGFNRHLYLNLLCNIESQIESWNRSAVRSPNPETAHALWLKAEGLGYSLRLLYAFEPEFQDLVEWASKGAEFGLTVPITHDRERKSQ